MLDVRRLRVLREVALRGSIAGAAESLRFTPSAVSQQVAKLEREAGVPLVERGPRSVSLTPAGWRWETTVASSGGIAIKWSAIIFFARVYARVW